MVEDFELRYAAFRGLNLTFEVREGIIKHSHDYDADRASRVAEYLLDLRPPLEAQLIDLTDEIAYNTADLDDGYESQAPAVDRFASRLPSSTRSYRRSADACIPMRSEKLQFNEALRAHAESLRHRPDHKHSRRITASGVRTLGRCSPACRSGWPAFSAEVDEERRQAKQFLYRNLYYSEELVERKEHGEEVVLELFAYWLAHPEDLPRTYQEKAQEEPLARIVCDYVAGVTDHFILERHKKYCGK